MNGTNRWNLGPLVDGACPNENCAEHMIAVRYPATMEYVDHRNVIFSYVDLPMRCSTCGSLYPPANETQLETQAGGREKTDPVMAVMDAHVARMREKSGTINTDDKLVMFLYLLARDWVPTGTIDEIVDYKMPAGNGRFTNGWLAAWAEDVAIRLQAEPEMIEGGQRPPDPDNTPKHRVPIARQS